MGNPYAARRQRLLEALGPRTAAVLVSTPSAIRNNDVEHDYRQDSNVFYYTGFDEPETVVVIAPSAKTKLAAEGEAVSVPFTMFVRPRDPEREVWDGYRAGIDGAKEKFGADAAFPIDDVGKKLSDLLVGHDAVVYRWGTPFDATLFGAVHIARRTGSRTGALAPTRLVDPVELISEHRLRKSPEEIDDMRRACAITTEAHRRAMAIAAPGRFEYELEAVLLEVFRRGGSERPAYGSIVGSGPNATVLHYRKNDRKLEDGDLVLIDAGCEYGYYASDVTRTFPANGRFSDVQRRVYQTVLDAQVACIEMIRPGVTQAEVHEKAVDVLTRGLVSLGALTGDLAELLKTEAYKPYYMHKTGHWLGMDVHDVGAYYAGAPGTDGKLAHRPLEPGMVVTIEPGLYFSVSADKLPPELRGIGVRIEDDILVTEQGYENLTAAIPKTIEDVEAACRG